MRKVRSSLFERSLLVAAGAASNKYGFRIVFSGCSKQNVPTGHGEWIVRRTVLPSDGDSPITLIILMLSDNLNKVLSLLSRRELILKIRIV